jgi:hypothetical protein
MCWGRNRSSVRPLGLLQEVQQEIFAAFNALVAAKPADLQMGRFDGKSWVLFGDVLGEK